MNLPCFNAGSKIKAPGFIWILPPAFFLYNAEINAQKIVQTVKGTVYDKKSKISLPDATVYIPGTNPVKGTITDENGSFRLENTETGRIQNCVRFIRYEPLCIDNLNLTSGKELVVNIEIQESVTNINEVVVKANQNKSSAINTMSTLSSRTFYRQKPRGTKYKFNRTIMIPDLPPWPVLFQNQSGSFYHQHKESHWTVQQLVSLIEEKPHYI
jgi:hypothetical protein